MFQTVLLTNQGHIALFEFELDKNNLYYKFTN